MFQVRIRSRDIAPADRESSKQPEPEASPVPKSKVAIKVGRHKGQTGRVSACVHWLAVPTLGLIGAVVGSWLAVGATWERRGARTSQGRHDFVWLI